MRCTNAVLQSFGVHVSHNVNYGTGVLEHLNKAGYSTEPMFTDRSARLWDGHKHGLTIRSFARQFPIGDFYLFTNGHALALHNGKLTDTQEKGFDLRRVAGAYRITRKRDAIAASSTPKV